MDLRQILQITCDREASDLFLKVDNVPHLRVMGEIVPVSDCSVLNVSDLNRFISEITGKYARRQGLTPISTTDMDLAIDVEGFDRFRISIFFQRGVPSIVMRRIKKKVPDFKTLNLPEEILQKLSQERRGIILLTGPAGNGKSTTIASMIEYMNQTLMRHIITVEDPVEFTFSDKKSVINQRELGFDVTSYPLALRQVTLQSPDVIFIGNIRDYDTMLAVLNASEMGMLVLSTLHTVNASQTVQRIVNFFQPHQHAEIRSQLSFLLKGVISLRLASTADGSGRVPAYEVMTLTPTISRLMREGGMGDIPKYLEEGSLFGMTSFKKCLARLVKDNIITEEEAYKHADSKDDLMLEIRGIKRLI